MQVSSTTSQIIGRYKNIEEINREIMRVTNEITELEKQHKPTSKLQAELWELKVAKSNFNELPENFVHSNQNNMKPPIDGKLNG